MRLIKVTLISIIATLLFGCGKSGNSTSLLASVTDKVKDIFEPDETVKAAKLKVQSISDQLNNDPNYQITGADLAELKLQEIVKENTDLNGWVK